MEFQVLSINNVRLIKQLVVNSKNIRYAFCSVSRTNNLRLVAMSPNNQYLACASSGFFRYRMDDTSAPDSCLSIVDYKCNRVVHRLPYLGNQMDVVPQCLRYSPDGEYLAFDDGDSLYVWDLKHGGLVLKHQHINVNYDRISPSVSFRFLNIDKTCYLYVANPTNIQIIDIRSSDVSSEFIGYYRGAVIRQEFHHENISSQRFLSPNGRSLVTIPQKKNDKDERILYLRTAPRYEIVWSHPITNCACLAKTQAVCFHPNSELLAVGKKGQVSIFRIPEGKLVSTLRLPRDFDVESLAFNPDGELLAIGLLKAWMDRDDIEPTTERVCSIWDWEWGTQIVQLPEKKESPDFYCDRDLDFSYDGSRLIMRTDDQIQIWGVPQEQEQPTQNYQPFVDELMELPDGYVNWDDYWDSTPD